MTITACATSWACTDCLFLLANGDTPDYMNETETATWLAAIKRRSSRGHWTLGMVAADHADDCPNVDHDTGEWLGADDCYCEQIDFSMSPCDVCGSHLGGQRDAVTFWIAP